MSDLVSTGPSVLDLRWGQRTGSENGRRLREFYPKTHHREARGYLHPGVAASACVGAARLMAAPTDDVTSVSVSQPGPVPLGVDLRAVIPDGDDPGDREVRDTLVELERMHPPAEREEVVQPLLRGSVRFEGYTDPPELHDIRELARGPAPDMEEHDLYAGCWACGQDSVGGLGLLPGWVTDGRVVSRFQPDESFGDGNGRITPELMTAMLSCPTLWASRHHLDDRDAGGALLTDYEVHIHDEPRITTVLRTIGYDGEPSEDRLHGMSALADENGRIYATAFASWRLTDEEPSREPGEPTPLHYRQPLKAGRPENRSSEEWGETLPGRREMPGPRTDAPETYSRMDPDPEKKGPVRSPRTSTRQGPRGRSQEQPDPDDPPW